MKLGDAKVGDRVRIYITEAGRATRYVTKRTMLATVYGEHRTYGDMYLGWDATENRPCDDVVSRNPRNTSHEATYMKGHEKYVWRLAAGEDWQIAGIENNTDMSDWRTWANHGLQPGECVCRIPREKCTYHRERRAS